MSTGRRVAPTAFVLRYALGSPDDRLLVVNLGAQVEPASLAEPLLAPPDGCDWVVAWSSESVHYGGNGQAPLEPNGEWHFPGEAAVLLRAEPRPEETQVEPDGH